MLVTAPAVDEVTFTITVQPPEGMLVPLAIVKLPAPAVAVTPVQVPVLPAVCASFTVTVSPLPATVGVTLALLNTPELNVPDGPVTPAVPPNVTVPPKLVTVLLFASCAVIVAMVNGVPAVEAMELLLDKMGKTKSNAEFLASMQRMG